ncbi:hypothetical protein JCM8097_005210 [Rhodosporidiobolus ruineniae]
MFAAAALAASLALSGVAAVPVQLAQLSAVEAALSPSNATHTNQTAVEYRMNGNAGACGWYNEDSDVVVGLPLEEYEDLASVSSYCGQFVVVTDPRVNKTITALVADASASNNTLSLSQASWNALNGTDSELQFVDFRFANETETADAKKALEADSSSSSVAPSTTSTYQAPSSSAAPATTSTYQAPSSSAAPATTSSAAAQYKQQEQATTSAKSSTTSYAPKTTTTTTSYAPKKTTTTEQAAATKQAQSYSSSSSSSSGSTYSGTATYFYQNGVAGACGSVHSDSSYIVALQTSMYAGGSHCGQTVTITGNGKTITAKVADECPSCGSSGDLDLSEGAFKALSSLDAGVASITWSFSS